MVSILKYGPYDKQTGNLNCLFSFEAVKESDVINLLRNLQTKKATGHDGINSKLLKIASPHISNSLTCLFNKCLQNGVFSDIFKVARVQPIFKSGEETNV